MSIEFTSLESRQMFLSPLQKKWVLPEKEVTLSPSCFGRVYQFPQ